MKTNPQNLKQSNVALFILNGVAFTSQTLNNKMGTSFFLSFFPFFSFFLSSKSLGC
ncbi:hypothetical protein LguiA_029755 [Lonicera macranthoides]